MALAGGEILELLFQIGRGLAQKERGAFRTAPALSVAGFARCDAVRWIADPRHPDDVKVNTRGGGHRSGARNNNPGMSGLLAGTSDANLGAIADYLAGL